MSPSCATGSASRISRLIDHLQSAARAILARRSPSGQLAVPIDLNHAERLSYLATVGLTSSIQPHSTSEHRCAICTHSQVRLQPAALTQNDPRPRRCMSRSAQNMSATFASPLPVKIRGHLWLNLHHEASAPGQSIQFSTPKPIIRPLLTPNAARRFPSLPGWCSRRSLLLRIQPRSQDIVMHTVHNLHITDSPQHQRQQTLNTRNRFRKNSAANA